MIHTASSGFASALADKGVRLTRQRRILLDLLEHSPTHLRARDLLEQAQRRDPRVNRATVYRTLALLKQAGLVDELDLLHLEGEDHYYERRDERDHVHIGCTSCGQIAEMETELLAWLKAEIEAKTGSVVDGMRIEVRSRCPKCRPA